MPLAIGVLKETHPGERRLTVVPDVVKKYQGLGARLVMQKDAGKAAHFRDTDFADVTWVDTAEELAAAADVVLCVQPPAAATVAAMKAGSVLCGMLQPWSSAERAQQLADGQLTAFALELLPRISRAQSMDVLSSQAAVAGYECALIAADHSPKFFPMLTYAAGTIRPAKVLVIGAGVAGLQAIATAKRSAPWSPATTCAPKPRSRSSRWAPSLSTPACRQRGAAMPANSPTTRSASRPRSSARPSPSATCSSPRRRFPGKKAPVIVTADMVARMKPGSVVVDMAAETGGNVAGTVAWREDLGGRDVLIIGPTNIPAACRCMPPRCTPRTCSISSRPSSRTGPWPWTGRTRCCPVLPDPRGRTSPRRVSRQALGL
jgi:NAD(P) transhydrogenase subunit alpha